MVFSVDIVGINLSVQEQITHLSTHLHDEAAVVFWSFIDDPDPLADGLQMDCTEWQSAYDGGGNPAHLCAGEYVYAAVYAMLAIGKAPTNKRRAWRNTCGNQRCVNPNHLVWIME